MPTPANHCIVVFLGGRAACRVPVVASRNLYACGLRSLAGLPCACLTACNASFSCPAQSVSVMFGPAPLSAPGTGVNYVWSCSPVCPWNWRKLCMCVLSWVPMHTSCDAPAFAPICTCRALNACARTGAWHLRCVSDHGPRAKDLHWDPPARCWRQRWLGN